MAKNGRFAQVIRQIGVMVKEARRLREPGVRLLIRHRFSEPGTLCLPGEEVLGIWVTHRRREFALPLGVRLRLLLDFLARHRYIAQSAGQIAAGMNCDEFCQRHGANARTKALVTRGVSRTAIKQQIMRLRGSLRQAFRKAGLGLDPCRVLISEKTTVNEVRYRLKATVTWHHSKA